MAAFIVTTFGDKRLQSTYLLGQWENETSGKQIGYINQLYIVFQDFPIHVVKRLELTPKMYETKTVTKSAIYIFVFNPCCITNHKKSNIVYQNICLIE